MSFDFEELDFRRTRIGELSLRRRLVRALGIQVFEVKLGDDFLMSSLFTAGEVALAELGLRAAGSGPLDVVVGGLGLGHTAHAALQNREVRSLLVVEALPEIIDWHRRGMVPLGKELSEDPRCRLCNADFFAFLHSAGEGLDPEAPARKFHAVLLDVDHSPRHVLHPSHASLYEPEGLEKLAGQLHPGGIFALWSNDPPDRPFLAALAGVFAAADAQVVEFHNPLQNRAEANTVYIARAKSGRDAVARDIA